MADRVSATMNVATLRHHGTCTIGLGIVFERKDRMVPAHDQLAWHDSAPSKLGL